MNVKARTMRNLIIAIFLSCTLQAAAQDYYEQHQTDTVQVLTKKEQRRLDRERRKAHERHCYCPYQQTTSVWHDIWNDGVVGTTKAVYQSTVKPQVIGQVVGGVQGAANEAPVPTIVAETGTALAISEVQKSRRHQRNRQVPQAGRVCDCDPCPYHGQRYKPAQGIH
jgi:hypothetical protein